MKKALIASLVQVLAMTLTPELLVKFADMALDFVENEIEKSTTKLDDKLILPICNSIRRAFNIPDNDE